MTYRRASVTLMTVLTGFLCFFALLFSTPWGAQLTLFLVGSTSSTQVEYRSGTLLNNLQLNQLTINSDNVIVEAEKIRLQVHLRCFWERQLCIDELSIASLKVNIIENSSTSADELINGITDDFADNITTEIVIPPFFTLPFTVKINQLSLAKVQIKKQDLAINLTGFSSALSINKLAINVEDTNLSKAYITLPNAQNSSVHPLSSRSEPWFLAALPKVSLPFTLTVRSFAVETLIVNEMISTGDDNTLLHIEDAVAQLSWFNTKLTIERLSAMIATVGNFSLLGKVNLVPPYTVDVSVSSAIKDSEVLAQLNNSTQQVFLQGDLAQLTVTANSEGSLALTAEAVVDITDANLPYNLTANITQLTLPSEMSNIIEPSIFSLQSQGDINKQAVDFTSKFSGLGYQDMTLELAANFHKNIMKVTTLHLRDINADNMLTMTGELHLGEALSWNINLDSTGLTLPNIDKRLSGRVQGNIKSRGFYQGDEWALSLVDSALKGEINHITLDAQATIDINHKGELAPSNVRINYGDIALDLTGYSDEEWHIDGLATIANTHLWLKNIESSLKADIRISGAIEQPEISLQGEVKKLLIADLSSDVINFDAIYSPMNNHQHQVTFTSLLMNWKEHTINNVNIASGGDLAQQQVNLTWFGDSSIDLLIDSHYSPVNDQWNIQTNNAVFSIGEHVFQPSQSIKLLYKVAQNTLAINEHCWLGTLSQLCLNDNAILNLTKDELALAVKVNTELLTTFIPEDMRLDSTIDGHVTIGWQQGNIPSVDAKLLISAGDIQMNKAGQLRELLAWQKGRLNLQMHSNQIAGDIALFSSVGNSDEILSAATAISLADNRITNSHISMTNFNVAPLHVFVPELSLLEGTLNTKLAIGGYVDHPTLIGGITLAAGKVNVLGDINTLEDIKVAFDFKGQQAIISGGLNVNDVAVSFTGNADWQDELQANFNVDGESIKLSIPPDLTVTVSPHLNAKIHASALTLSGRVEVLEGKLLVNKLPQGSVSLSKDAIIVNDEGEQITHEKPFDVLTNIRVIIADTFQIEGQGFVGRLGGELQVSQQLQQPLQLFGSLKIPEGRYRAYGQDLSMTKGSIAFNGSVSNPYVSMQATRRIEKEDITVGIDATGLANSLQIKLFSNPSMQQSETLSYLVRGRGLDAETNDSNAAIGVALGTVLTNYSGVLTQIEKLPLLNRIEVDGDDEQASIAGYLGDQVYIKYGVGVIEPIQELTVRFYLLSRLWVEAVSGLENSANIYYSFDID